MTELWKVLAWEANNQPGMMTYDGKLWASPGSFRAWPTELRLAQWTTEFQSAALPSHSEQRRSRIGDIIAIPRSDWTSAQSRELPQLRAQESIS